jgi:hypothetical protein
MASICVKYTMVFTNTVKYVSTEPTYGTSFCVRNRHVFCLYMLKKKYFLHWDFVQKSVYAVLYTSKCIANNITWNVEISVKSTAIMNY